MAAAVAPADIAAIDVDALIEPHLSSALRALDGPAPLLVGMAGYHLGRLTANLTVAPDPVRMRVQGKRLRPRLALLTCAATGGEPATAAPVAAAIELLHNFTLIHDDIQDESIQRRHRETVWALWGSGQAINAGDALFAAAHLALNETLRPGIAPEVVIQLGNAFARMTIAIVQGQVLDLGFEGRNDVSAAAYLEMISLKTAAIVRFACWAGALLGGGERTAGPFADFGEALGLGFQVQDDLLGIWGAPEATGKSAADDIRRRKQSLPILLLRERASPAEQAEIDTLYARETIDDAGIARMLDLLAGHRVREAVEAQVATLHERARAALTAAAPPGDNPARIALLALVDSLAARVT